MSFIDDHPFLSGFFTGFASATMTSRGKMLDDDASKCNYLQGKHDALETCLDALRELSLELDLSEEDSEKYESFQEKMEETMKDIKMEMKIWCA